MEKKEKMNIKVSKRKIRIKPIALVLIFVLIVLGIGLIWGIKSLWITLKYKEYTEKMYTYGLAELYDNKKATAIQKVTNDEMIKIVLAATYGNTDIENLEYETSIPNNKLKEKATKIESIMFLTKSLETFQDIEILASELKMSKSKLSKFTLDEQELIAKAVSLEIIKNINSELSTKNIIKGELNKLVVTIIEKYATIYYKSKFPSSSKTNLVTDIDKMPKNYKSYPYIIDSIPKEIYEYTFGPQNLEGINNAQTPNQVYKRMGTLFGQIDEHIVDYFYAILNVDYNNINKEDFLNSINSNVLYRMDVEEVQEYVDYVKEHKIKLKGKATPLLPIIYYNGTDYVVRTNITFEVLNSDTEYNLLFGDETQKVKYNDKKIIMYVDLPMGMTLNSNSLRVRIQCLAKNKLSNSTSVVVEK